MLNREVKDAVPTVSYAYPPMETESMGDRIRRLRGAKGYTQEELAKLVGVTKSADSQWEDDSTANIKLTPLLRLVEALGTDVEYLVHGDTRMPAGGPGSSGRWRRIR